MGGSLAPPLVQSLVRAQGSRHHCTCVAQLGQGEGECWPDPHAQVVILYNGTDHFCGLCPRGWGGKPANECQMGMGTCRALRVHVDPAMRARPPPTLVRPCRARNSAL